MKIALVAPTHIPARRANTIQVMKMAQALAQNGHAVRLAAPAAPHETARPAWEELAAQYGLQARFPVEWLPAHPRLRRYDYAWRSLGWARAWGAELVYTRLVQAAALAAQVGQATILELHDLPGGRVGPFLVRRFLHARGARRLALITRALAADLGRSFRLPPGDFVLVAPDGVDLERYQDLPAPEEIRRQGLSTGSGQPLALDAGRFTVGYTGHLYAGRGVELILALAGRLPGMTFLLAGGEPGDIERVRAQAARLGLDNLQLAGYVPNASLPRYQAACDVLLMPYATQVAASSGGNIAPYLSPMKLFEYLACGRAILSSDLPVLREALNPRNAILLPPGDLAAWEQALCQLQSEPELRQQLGRAARQDAQAYTWTARARQILAGLAPGGAGAP